MMARSASSKARMNSRPMILRLVSGSETPARALRNRSGLVGDVELDAGGGDEVAFHLLGFALAQQPVVHEDAGQLVADGALHQRGGHGGVDAAGQSADDPGVADLLADPLHLLFDNVARGPVGLQPGAVEEEVLQHLLAVVRVLDLRVPLHAEQALVLVGEGRDRRPAVLARTSKPSGARWTLSPWLIQAFWCVGTSGQDGTALADGGDVSVAPYSRSPVWATLPPRAAAMAWKP